MVVEAYEVLEGIGSGLGQGVGEELGVLFFQIIFHARLAAEAGDFTIGEVLDHLARKMIRRHPHVFGDSAVTSARQALAQWETIKQSEASAARRVRSVLEGGPRSLPSLLRAQRLQSKAARIGFDWPDAAAA